MSPDFTHDSPDWPRCFCHLEMTRPVKCRAGQLEARCSWIHSSMSSLLPGRVTVANLSCEDGKQALTLGLGFDIWFLFRNLVSFSNFTYCKNFNIGNILIILPKEKFTHEPNIPRHQYPVSFSVPNITPHF